MTVSVADLDAHEQPSDEMKAEWKAFSRVEQSVLLESPSVIDDPRLPLDINGFKQSGTLPRSRMAEAFSKLDPALAAEAQDDCPILHHPLLPGLLIIPNLIPPPVQIALLDSLMHRDLSNPTHQTNLHLHYTLPYPPPGASFFSSPPDSPPKFHPKDPAVHKPLSLRQVLQRRLHWLTLGGQYDWTNRVYPAEAPPDFPRDLSGFLMALFPATVAQAAIVNLYTPGDTMMMHRDVSEEADKGLVSLSLGCDGLFMIAPDMHHDENNTTTTNNNNNNNKKYLLLRLRSGDAIYMTQESRFAWHGVPKVLKGTCPEYLSAWPAMGPGEEYSEWRGWMANKRINLNVRQMKEVQVDVERNM